MVDHEYLRNVLLHGFVAVQRADFLQGGGQSSGFSLGGGVTWLVNRNVRLSATYDFTDQRRQQFTDAADHRQLHAQHRAADGARRDVTILGTPLAGGLLHSNAVRPYSCRQCRHNRSAWEAAVQLSHESLIKAYRDMVTIRRFEERVQEEFSKGGIPGFVHLYAGQEASAVGVCSHLGPSDHIASTHRGHGHSIAKGCDVTGMMMELFAKQGGLCGGKGGSMHIADLDQGMLGANGIVGGGPPLVVGAALTAKTLGTGNVAVSFTGDGGSNQGTTFEAMNMAVVLQLPAIFVFENNGYGEYTGASYAVGSHDIAGRAAGFGHAGGEGAAATISSPCTRRRARRWSARATAAGRARSRSIPAASTAITPATHSSIAARTRCGGCARSATA